MDPRLARAGNVLDAVSRADVAGVSGHRVRHGVCSGQFAICTACPWLDCVAVVACSNNSGIHTSCSVGTKLAGAGATSSLVGEGREKFHGLDPTCETSPASLIRTFVKGATLCLT